MIKRLNALLSVLVMAQPLLLWSGKASAELIFLEMAGQVVVEAETFSSREGFELKSWSIVPEESPGFPAEFNNFRGTGYVQALPDTNTGGGGPTEPPLIDYKVRINTPGTYRLYLRWASHNDNSDTLYANIVELQDGIGGAIADWYRYIRISGEQDFAAGPTWFGSGGFERTDSPYSNGETPVLWTISTPGDCTIRFSMREDGAAIDTFVFQHSDLPAPTGEGPPPSLFVNMIFSDGFESDLDSTSECDS